MKFNPEKPHRRSIRLKDYDYASAGAYFVTICTYNKRCILGDVMVGNMILNQFGEIVEAEWLKTFDIRKNLMPDAFIIMPNHFHGIIVIDESCRGTLQRAPYI
jgi:REP-associated tyrosine transposase